MATRGELDLSPRYQEILAPMDLGYELFDKVGVRSRRELVGQVFAQHYGPRMASGQEPNADGWFA